MPEQESESSRELLKAIKDKLSELEDMQLVNKLDIINMKNELDRISLTSAPSSETLEKLTQLAKIAEKADVLKKVEKSQAELEKLKSELEKVTPADIQSMKMELEKLRKKMSGMETAPPRAEAATGTKDMVDIKMEIGSIRSVLDSYKGLAPSLEKFKARIEAIERSLTSQAAAKPAMIPQNLKAEIDSVSKDVESLKSILDDQRARISKAGAAKQSGAVPADVSKRVDKIESSVSSLDSLLGELKKEVRVIGALKGQPGSSDVKKMILDLEKKVAKLSVQPMPSAKQRAAGQEKFEGILKDVKISMEKQGREISGAKANLQKSLDLYEKKLERIEKVLPEKKEKDTELEELRKDVQILSASVPKGLPAPKRISDMLKEMEDVRSKTNLMEKKLGTLDQEALEDLKRLHGQFPIEEFEKLKEEMLVLERKLEKTSRLAAELKPLEMPEKAGEKMKIPPEFEKRVESLEKRVAGGASPGRVKELERRIEDVKSKLPDQLEKATAKRIEELKQKIDSKMHELEDLKRDMVENTIEQLLAQPDNVGRLVDKRLKEHVEELSKRVETVGHKVSPADAKLTSLIRESEEKDRELDKIKESLRDIDEKSRSEMEALEIEIRAMNTKLGTMNTSVKGMEGAGAAGVLRDLEILKTKTEWLESMIQKLDLKPIYEKLEELEERVMAAGGYSPLVIE